VKCEIVDVSKNMKVCLSVCSLCFILIGFAIFYKMEFYGDETGCTCYCNCTSDLVRGPIQGLKVNDMLVPKRRHTDLIFMGISYHS